MRQKYPEMPILNFFSVQTPRQVSDEEAEAMIAKLTTDVSCLETTCGELSNDIIEQCYTPIKRAYLELILQYSRQRSKLSN